MSTTYKTADIVAALRKMGHMELKETLARTGELFPDASLEQMDRAFEIAADDAREEARELEAETKWIKAVVPIFDGLPKGTTLEEAAVIKALQGDPVAARVVVQLASPAYRLNAALGDAAMAADPKNWRKTKDGYRWLGKGEMPDMYAMIEQFQINHPTEARKIEEEIEAA